MATLSRIELNGYTAFHAKVLCRAAFSTSFFSVAFHFTALLLLFRWVWFLVRLFVISLFAVILNSTTTSTTEIVTVKFTPFQIQQTNAKLQTKHHIQKQKKNLRTAWAIMVIRYFTSHKSRDDTVNDYETAMKQPNAPTSRWKNRVIKILKDAKEN